MTPCDAARARPNKGAFRKKARQFNARVAGSTGGHETALKRRLRQTLEERGVKEAACKRAKEEIVFRPSYRDPETGRFVSCRGVSRNPRGRRGRGVMVYPQVETIFARKPNGQLYRHDFQADAPLIGQADGSLKIPGSPRKWADVDGEPWIVNPPTSHTRRRRGDRAIKGTGRSQRNPHLAIYGAANPPGGDDMARRRNRKGQFMKRSRHAGGKHRASVAHRRSSRRRHVRRHYRRNPPALGRVSGLIPPLRTVGEGVLGATAARFIAGQASKFLPAAVTSNTPGRVAVGAASAIAGGFLGSMVLGRQSGANMAAGGLIVMADELTRAYVLPALGLSAYVDDSGVSAFVGEYVDSADVQALPGAEEDELAGWMEEADGMGDTYVPRRLNIDSRL